MKVGQKIALGVVLVLALFAGFVWWQISKKYLSEEALQTNSVQIDEQEVISEQEQKREFDTTLLQAAVDDWVRALNKNAAAGVVIMLPDGTVLAEHNADEEYFAASIYKLYVAYEGYRGVDEGSVSVNDPYVNGHSRGDCLDLMVRESDSPCGEKMLSEFGQSGLTTALSEVGLTHTSMRNITTTARDAATMLGIIARGQGIATESQDKLLASMENQIYDEALKAGFSSEIIVYDKVGFRQKVEYHDVGIIELPNGSLLIVSVLSKNVGADGIAQLARQLETAIAR